MKKIFVFIQWMLLLLPCFSFAQPFEKKLMIREIRYIGVSSVSSREIEDLLTFSPGDTWREEFPAITEKALAEYYAKRGFNNAIVKITNIQAPGGMVVVISIQEGKPCLVNSINMNDPPGFKSVHLLEKFRSKMWSYIHMKVGDRYDWQSLSGDLRELRDWLMDEDFILVNTDRVQLTYNADKTGVDIKLNINYGDRVTFGFQGNTVFSKGELDDMIELLRSKGLGKDYEGVIKRKFIEEYRNQAYNNIQIDIQESEKESYKHVTFFFHEGNRAKIVDIQWEGVSEENLPRVQEIFEHSVSHLVQRGYYVDKEIDKAVGVVIENLKSNGYLSSKFITKYLQPVQKKSHDYDYFHVLIQISEGEQTLIGTIDIDGFSGMSSDQVKAVLHIAEGMPFNPFALEDGLQQLRSQYIGNGYLEFKIDTPEERIVHFADSDRMANISVHVTEGLRIKVDSIHIEGLEKTQSFVVEREIAISPEDWWLRPKIQETETNLRKLGLFSDVKLKVLPSLKGPGYRNLAIELKEVEPGVFEAGPGFRSDLGIRAFSRVSYSNIAGKHWIGTLSAQGNRRVDQEYRFPEYQFDATFVEPRFFGTQNLYTIGMSTRKKRFPPDLNETVTQFTTGFERKLKDFSIFKDSITLKLFYSLERIRQFDVYVNGVYFPPYNQLLLIGSLIPTIIFDTRDSPFTITHGQITTLSLEYATPILSAQTEKDPTATGYYRWNGASHWYFPLTKDIIWSNVVAGGYERPNISKPIPLAKMFRLGGINSIRGFLEETINVDAIPITGSLTYLNFRTQIDLPMVGDLKFAPFLDAGNLYVNTLRNSPFFRLGAGAGLHYMTPIGPINLDYGFKLNPLPSDLGNSTGQIHFSVGFI